MSLRAPLPTEHLQSGSVSGMSRLNCKFNASMVSIIISKPCNSKTNHQLIELIYKLGAIIFSQRIESLKFFLHKNENSVEKLCLV